MFLNVTHLRRALTLLTLGCGSYPKFYMNRKKYRPTQDFHLDFNEDIGQRFLPHTARGFNFATLAHPLDEYVIMPGTVYPTNVSIHQ